MVHERLTWRSMKRVVQRALHEDGPGFELLVEPDWEMAVFDLHSQLKCVLDVHFDSLLTYREILKLENGDVLCSSDDLDLRDPIVLHLHLSTDGGQPFRFKKMSLWPLHATILDLPLYIRSKKENILLFGLWLSSTKPDWNRFVTENLKHSLLSQVTTFNVQNSMVDFKVIIHTAVFDLPALASVLSHHQYNGRFGCIFCCAPGTVTKIGRGYSRKYGGVIDLRSDSSYSECSQIAQLTGEPVFGVKGLSCLQPFLKIPSHILLDPLHLLFENCSKLLFAKLVDSPSFRCAFFLGRHVSYYDQLADRILIPQFLQRPRSLNELSFWKARDFLCYLFYYSIPTIYVSLFHKSCKEYAFHFSSFCDSF